MLHMRPNLRPPPCLSGGPSPLDYPPPPDAPADSPRPPDLTPRPDPLPLCAGFFGGCSELEMMRTLVSKGPLPVGFEVYPDFQSYKGGIYRHVAATRQFGFDPLEVRVLGTRALGSRADEQAHKRRRSTQFSHKTYSFHRKHTAFTENTQLSHQTHSFHRKHT